MSKILTWIGSGTATDKSASVADGNENRNTPIADNRTNLAQQEGTGNTSKTDLRQSNRFQLGGRRAAVSFKSADCCWKGVCVPKKNRHSSFGFDRHVCTVAYAGLPTNLATTLTIVLPFLLLLSQSNTFL